MKQFKKYWNEAMRYGHADVATSWCWFVVGTWWRVLSAFIGVGYGLSLRFRTLWVFWRTVLLFVFFLDFEDAFREMGIYSPLEIGQCWVSGFFYRTSRSSHDLVCSLTREDTHAGTVKEFRCSRMNLHISSTRAARLTAFFVGEIAKRPDYPGWET